MQAAAEALVLRAAIPDDAAAITACVANAFRHYIPRIGKPPGPMTEDYAEVIAQRDVTVALLGRALVGVLVLDETGEGFLLDIVAVDPAAQGKGVGRALLERAEARARDAGYASIYLFTNEKMTENQSLYARNGYVEYDRRQDEGYARVFMRKTPR